MYGVAALGRSFFGSSESVLLLGAQNPLGTISCGLHVGLSQQHGLCLRSNLSYRGAIATPSLANRRVELVDPDDLNGGALRVSA